MELILHPIPCDTVGAHAGPILTRQEVATLPPRSGATKARSHSAPHRRLERYLDRGWWNLLTACRVDQRLEHRRRAARKDLRGNEISEQVDDRTAMSGAPVVRGHLNVGARKPFCRQKPGGRARALKHRDLSATRHEGLHHSGE